MREAATTHSRSGDVGCEELGEMGLIETGGCCERCHAADGFALYGIGSFGPCRQVLADGRVALVCCTARKRLVRGSVET